MICSVRISGNRLVMVSYLPLRFIFSAGRIYGQALSFEVSEKVPQLLGLEVTTRKYFIKGSTVLSGIN